MPNNVKIEHLNYNIYVYCVLYIGIQEQMIVIVIDLTIKYTLIYKMIIRLGSKIHR